MNKYYQSIKDMNKVLKAEEGDTKNIFGRMFEFSGGEWVPLDGPKAEDETSETESTTDTPDTSDDGGGELSQEEFEAQWKESTDKLKGILDNDPEFARELIEMADLEEFADEPNFLNEFVEDLPLEVVQEYVSEYVDDIKYAVEDKGYNTEAMDDQEIIDTYLSIQDFDPDEDPTIGDDEDIRQQDLDDAEDYMDDEEFNNLAEVLLENGYTYDQIDVMSNSEVSDAVNNLKSSTIGDDEEQTISGGEDFGPQQYIVDEIEELYGVSVDALFENHGLDPQGVWTDNIRTLLETVDEEDLKEEISSLRDAEKPLGVGDSDDDLDDDDDDWDEEDFDMYLESVDYGGPEYSALNDALESDDEEEYDRVLDEISNRPGHSYEVFDHRETQEAAQWIEEQLNKGNNIVADPGLEGSDAYGFISVPDEDPTTGDDEETEQERNQRMFGPEGEVRQQLSSMDESAIADLVVELNPDLESGELESLDLAGKEELTNMAIGAMVRQNMSEEQVNSILGGTEQATDPQADLREGITSMNPQQLDQFFTEMGVDPMGDMDDNIEEILGNMDEVDIQLAIQNANPDFMPSGIDKGCKEDRLEKSVQYYNQVQKSLAGVRDALMQHGVTTVVDDHSHPYIIDRDGRGNTTGMVGETGVPHKHEISAYKVKSAQGHTHELI